MTATRRILLIAYACRPGEGSEPAIGWQPAAHLALRHHVTLITRPDNMPAIEAELVARPLPGLHVEYLSLPRHLKRLTRHNAWLRFRYTLWQRAAVRLVRRLVTEGKNDVVHHLTYATYAAPSAGARAGAPFVWGPLGGGEMVPPGMRSAMPRRGGLESVVRPFVRSASEFVWGLGGVALSSSVAIGTTRETAAQLGRLGASRVELMTQVALDNSELDRLGAVNRNVESAFRVVSAGRLLAWKGFSLGIEAFAKAAVRDSEYLIVGDGPDKERLERLAHQVGVGQRVKFLGSIPRDEALSVIGTASVLMHPSLHESGGFVVAEAMAARVPVVCLDCGGPAVLVNDASGFRAPVDSVVSAVEYMAGAIQSLASDPELVRTMGEAGRAKVLREHTWDVQVARFEGLYEAAIECRKPLA